MQGRGALRALLGALSLLAGVVVLAFFLFRVIPGDAARAQLGPTASEESVRALRHDLGLGRPVWEQFTSLIGGLVRGDMGVSSFNRQPVAPQILPRFSITATIGLQAGLIALVVSYGLNLLAWLRPAAGRCVLPLVRAGVLLPVFFTTVFAAVLLGIFFPSLSLSAGSAESGPFTQIVPSLLASLYPVAVMTTVLREKVLTASNSSWTRAARATGMAPLAVFHRALLGPSLVSWLAVWVNQISLVFFSAMVLEVILSIPGTGDLLLTAVQRRDYPVLQGLLIVNAVFFAALAAAGDIFYQQFDPRVRS
ncbi:MAG TPA: ABC transporter permease [Verrucomicrobiota bacterium]|nr:ABC transporter permease [Verrucomicrobiota bacterium]